MIDKTQRIVGGRLRRVLADGGYCSILDLVDVKEREVELFAPPSAGGSSRKCKSRSGEVQIPREEFDFDAASNSYRCPAGHCLAYRSRCGGRSLYQSTYQCDITACGSCTLAERCLSGKGPRMIKRTEGEELLEAQREKMSSEEAKSIYRVRSQTVELGFGERETAELIAFTAEAYGVPEAPDPGPKPALDTMLQAGEVEPKRGKGS